jgi:hypothetical protein
MNEFIEENEVIISTRIGKARSQKITTRKTEQHNYIRAIGTSPNKE